jgi:hypothetical protein
MFLSFLIPTQPTSEPTYQQEYRLLNPHLNQHLYLLRSPRYHQIIADAGAVDASLSYVDEFLCI